MRGRLPVQLRPSQPADLVRVGSPRDGGYLVDKRDVIKSDGLIAMGLERDWRFERHFCKISPVPVHAYDGCTSLAYLFDGTKGALTSLNWRWMARILVTVADYKLFFSGKRRHYRQFVATGDTAYQESDAGSVSMDEVLARMAGSSRTFLKIDIEGAEYLILDHLLRYAFATSGLAIEFHDCDTNMDKIIDFVERYPLTLVHVHVNSYGGLNEAKVPRVLEMTFSSTARRNERAPVIPHPLDQPNHGKHGTPLEFIAAAGMTYAPNP